MANPVSESILSIEHVKDYEKMNAVNNYLKEKQAAQAGRATTCWKNQTAWYNAQFKAFNIQESGEFVRASHNKKVGIKIQEGQEFSVHVNNQAGVLTEDQKGLIDHLFKLVLIKRIEQVPQSLMWNKPEAENGIELN